MELFFTDSLLKKIVKYMNDYGEKSVANGTMISPYKTSKAS
jgi:hypothetical protein